jgi:hypothetical protein
VTWQRLGQSGHRCRWRTLIAYAVHDHVVNETLERHGRELPRHPRVEGVMHEQVSQQRGDRRPLCATAIPSGHRTVLAHDTGFKPPAHIKQDPLLVRCQMVSDRLEDQLVIEVVEETRNVQIDHPRVAPAPLPAGRHRIHR